MKSNILILLFAVLILLVYVNRSWFKGLFQGVCAFSAKGWSLRSTEIKVTWEDTDRPWTTWGTQREHGEFVTVGFLKAWWWGYKFSFSRPRSAVYLDPTTQG